MMGHLPDRIFLCGFMGTGKSTIGRRLAEQLGLAFLDLDERIEKETGRTIPEIFEREGEPGFRQIERSQLMDVIRTFEGVIALGGGSLQNQHILDHVKLNGLLVFIESPFSVIFNRIAEDFNRPLLLNEQGNIKERDILKDEMKKLYRKRLPFYRQAPIQIDTGDIDSPDVLIDELARKIKNHVSHY